MRAARSESDLAWDAVNLVTIRDLIDQAIRVSRTVPGAQKLGLKLDEALGEMKALHSGIQDQLGQWHPELKARR